MQRAAASLSRQSLVLASAAVSPCLHLQQWRCQNTSQMEKKAHSSLAVVHQRSDCLQAQRRAVASSSRMLLVAQSRPKKSGKTTTRKAEDAAEDDEVPVVGTPVPVTKGPAFDAFGAEAVFKAPADGEELDLAATPAGVRVPWPDVQRQLQLFINNALYDAKSTTKGRAFLRDFDVLSNVTSIDDALELLYYMQRLSYPPESRLELSLRDWLRDNAKAIRREHLLDIARFAVEQQAQAHWLRSVLLCDWFIPRGLAMIRDMPVREGCVEDAAADLVLLARVLHRGSAGSGSGISGAGVSGTGAGGVERRGAAAVSASAELDLAKKRPLLRALVAKTAEVFEAAETHGEPLSTDAVGNVIMFIVPVDVSARALLHPPLTAALGRCSVVDVIKLFNAMITAGVADPSLVDMLVLRVAAAAEEAAAAKAAAATGAVSGKGRRKRRIKDIARDADPSDRDGDAAVDVTLLCNVLLMLQRLQGTSSAGAGPTPVIPSTAVGAVTNGAGEAQPKTRVAVVPSLPALKGVFVGDAESDAATPTATEAPEQTPGKGTKSKTTVPETASGKLLELLRQQLASTTALLLAAAGGDLSVLPEVADTTTAMASPQSPLLISVADAADVCAALALPDTHGLVRDLRTFLSAYLAHHHTTAPDTKAKGAKKAALAVTSDPDADATALEELGLALRAASKIQDAHLSADLCQRCEVISGRLHAARSTHALASVLPLPCAMRVLEGLAAVGAYPPKLVETCTRVTLEHRSDLTADNVATIIFVAGLCKGTTLGEEALRQLTSRLLNTVKFRGRTESLGPNAVAMLLRGLAAAGVKPDERLQAFLGEQAVNPQMAYSGRDSVSLLIVLHQLKLDQSPLARRLGAEVAAAIPSMNPDDLVRVAAVLSELGLRDVRLIDAISVRLCECEGILLARHLVSFATSLREMNFTALFAKAGLEAAAVALDDLSPNDATFLLTFCGPTAQEQLLRRFVRTAADLDGLSLEALVTVYSIASNAVSSLRTATLQRLKGSEAPLSLPPDVVCAALCRAIRSRDPDAIPVIVAFTSALVAKLSSTHVGTIIETLRSSIAASVPQDLPAAHSHKEKAEAKERIVQHANTKDELLHAVQSPAANAAAAASSELAKSGSLEGATYIVHNALFRVLGRRAVAVVDGLSIDQAVSLLEVYMHAGVRDDRVVKALFKRVARLQRTVIASPRLTQTALRLIAFFGNAWSQGLGSSIRSKLTVRDKTLVRSSLYSAF